jgi:hypothetical protein
MRMLWSTGSKDTSSKDIIYYVKIRIQGKYSFSANQPSLWSQLVGEATGRLPPGHNGGTSRVWHWPFFARETLSVSAG